MSTKRILIVEDDVISQRLYKHILNQNFDVEIDRTDSVEAALDYLKTVKYDLYIVDLQLNGELDGSILVNTNYRPMIVITGMHVEQELKSVGYLQKPIDNNRFIALVKEMLKV